MEWRMDEILKLINYYKQFDCLWNYRSANYKRIDLKKNAWIEISNACARDVDEIKKKIKHLRTAYVAEKKKVDNSRRSGSELEAVYQPHLFYFDEMNFLDSVIVLRKTTSNLPPLMDSVETFLPNIHSSVPPLSPLESEKSLKQCSSMSLTQAPPIPQTPSPRPSWAQSPPLVSQSPPPVVRRQRSRKSNSDEKIYNAIDTIVASINTPESENVFTSFGKSIALQLQQLPNLEANETMSEVQYLVTRKVMQSLIASQSDHNSSSSFRARENDPLEDDLNSATITFE